MKSQMSNSAAAGILVLVLVVIGIVAWKMFSPPPATAVATPSGYPGASYPGRASGDRGGRE